MKHSMKGLSPWLVVAPEGSSVIFPRNESRTITDLSHCAFGEFGLLNDVLGEDDTSLDLAATGAYTFDDDGN